MAKGGTGGNKAQLARIRYLDRAAQCLLKVKQTSSGTISSRQGDTGVEEARASLALPHKRGLPLLYTAQLCAVARKSQIRLSQDHKRRFCKVCKLPLVEGQTCTTKIENKSRGASKKWADVEVVTCNGCRTAKRRPVGAARQEKKAARGMT